MISCLIWQVFVTSLSAQLDQESNQLPENSITHKNI